MYKILAIAILVFLISSCTSVYKDYDGPTQPEANIGIIEIPDTIPVHPLIINYVDGKRRSLGFTKRYELTPGERELYIESIFRGYRFHDNITYLTVEAGKKYTIERIINRKVAKDIFGVDVFGEGNWYVLIKEKGTNTVVNYPKSRKLK